MIQNGPKRGIFCPKKCIICVDDQTLFFKIQGHFTLFLKSGVFFVQKNACLKYKKCQKVIIEDFHPKNPNGNALKTKCKEELTDPTKKNMKCFAYGGLSDPCSLNNNNDLIDVGVSILQPQFCQFFGSF